MPVPDQDAVRAILADFHQRLRTVVDGAWEEWLAIEWRGKLVYPARARATLVFDFIARRAQEEFAGDANIAVLAQKQTVKFMFKDQVVLRFKKGNAKGIGSNVVTQAVLDFIDPQGVIPGLIPEIMKVEVCWSPGDLGIDLDGVNVVARDRRKMIWAYPLDSAAADGVVVPLPVSPPDESPPQLVPRTPQPAEADATEEE
jgi:hypothetical protein